MSLFDGADVISSYSRAQAIEDGVLVDVTETAREAGFSIPVAVTRGVWEDCVGWDDDTDKRKPEFTGQSESGRLWDVLWMAGLRARAIAASNARADRGEFEVLRIPRQGRGVLPRTVRLALHVGPGDDAEPVITIMLPGED